MPITWNPADKDSKLTLSNGNLTVTHTGGSIWGGVRATTSKAAGQWYWEIVVTTDIPSTAIRIGIGTSGASLTGGVGDDANGYGYNGADGYKVNNGSAVAYGNTYTTGDIIGVALDLDAGKIWFGKNNVWQASGDPAAGTNEAYSGISGTFFPMQSTAAANDVLTARFSSVDQTYAPPAGFAAIDPDTTLILTDELSAATSGSAALQLDFALVDSFSAVSAITTDGPFLGVVDTCTFTAASSLTAKTAVDVVGTLSVAGSGSSNTQIDLVLTSNPLTAEAALTCNDSFNYADIEGACPTPTCTGSAVFRYARMDSDADVPVPTASCRVGRIIEGDCPVSDFTCSAYTGRKPSLIASSPVPSGSMRVGINIDDIETMFHNAGVPVPTCGMVADTHYVADIYGYAPAPSCTITADTVNLTSIYGSSPVPTSLFTTTVGNVADIRGRVAVPTCSMDAINGSSLSLSGSVPVPGTLVRFYASLLNVSITLDGDVPVPTMTSSVLCSLPSSELRHDRGSIR